MASELTRDAALEHLELCRRLIAPITTEAFAPTPEVYDAADLLLAQLADLVELVGDQGEDGGAIAGTATEHLASPLQRPRQTRAAAAPQQTIPNVAELARRQWERNR